jgi:exopolyphosphatase / guanosine-5'-triphosphate,3'-diphosphate pyrophosphatase
MISAIIDCGTNTFHLLIAKHDNAGNYEIIHADIRNVKLGQNTILKNEISPEAMQRGIIAFNEFVDKAKEFKSDQIYATATSAVRSSKNGNVFVDEVFDKTGVKINVIDGNREAQLIYNGVKLALSNIDDTVLIMDIGGGSTEFILAKNNTIIYKHSFDLGVARILQKFSPSDPIKSIEISEIKEFLKVQLQPLAEIIAENPVNNLIGCSGSFESIHSIISNELYNKNPNNTEIEKFDNDDFSSVYQKLIKSKEKERYSIKGLIPMRVDTIVLASIFIEFIKSNFGIKNVFVSYFALKEGVLAELLQL